MATLTFVSLVFFTVKCSDATNLYALPRPSPAAAPTLPIPDPLAPDPSSSSYLPEPNLSPYPARSPGGIKAAYWPSFTGFPASSIDSSYFTHIYYAFLLLDPVTFQLNITAVDQTKLPEFVGSLRRRSPPVKTLLSIGGQGSNLTAFSQMASTRKTRLIFINSTIQVARNYGFDGVDLDWEFPATVEEMSNLATLYKEWRKALHDESKSCRKPRLLLTSAVYYSSIVPLNGVIRSYPAAAIREYVDWVNPMCYDYHGVWENITGQHSALYDFDPNSKLSTDYGIGSWIQAGVPPQKLVMGLPAYGHTWQLKDPNVTGVRAEAVGPGPGGDSGLLGYDEIRDFNRENNATVKFDTETVSYYSYSGEYWIGYDDAGSIVYKVRFGRGLGLGGYFFWALGNDKNWTLSIHAAKAWGY